MSVDILRRYSLPPEDFDPLAGHPDPERLTLDSLQQGTLLAGREKTVTWELDEITSEGALHRYRAQAEIEALINLSERGPVEIEIDEAHKETLRSLYSPEHFDPEIVVRLDHLGYKGRPPLEHDVKAVEVYLGELLDEADLGHLKEWVHFGMTSEDTNNLAFNYMLRDVANRVLVPAVARVADRLAHLAATYADTPTLGTTHAQKASPTTVGKQFGYLLSNMTQAVSELVDLRLAGKFSGAVGNHNPMTVLFPDFDYDAYARDFVESQGFDYSSVENQRNNHLGVTNFLGVAERLAVVGKDATDNVWLQILNGSLTQKLVRGERGSSTMSHKINPWRLENAEALFEQAIALASRALEGLVASRHERDLSDHDWQRAYGDILGRIVAGFNYFAIQLDRLAVDESQTSKSLDESAEVLSELIQTAGRASGDPEAYDRVVALTQGKRLDLAGIQDVVMAALPDSDLRDRVLGMTPEHYTGVAGDKAREAVLGWHAVNGVVSQGVLDESTSIYAVGFDLDGTLHFGDKEELYARITAISEGLKLALTEDDIQQICALSRFPAMKELMVRLHNEKGVSTITANMVQAMNDSVTGQFDDRFYAAPHAVETLKKLRKSGKGLYLATQRGPNSLPRVMRQHGFDDLFDVVVGGNDINRPKPHPEPLLIGLGHLGVNPGRSLFVGDSLDEDVAAGNAAGARTIYVGEKAPGELDPKPTRHWTDLSTLARFYSRGKRD